MDNPFQHGKPITVEELIKVLENYPKDRRVALSIDSEGNEIKYIPNDEFLSSEYWLPLNSWGNGDYTCYEDDEEPDYANYCQVLTIFPCN